MSFSSGCGVAVSRMIGTSRNRLGLPDGADDFERPVVEQGRVAQHDAPRSLVQRTAVAVNVDIVLLFEQRCDERLHVAVLADEQHRRPQAGEAAFRRDPDRPPKGVFPTVPGRFPA